MVSIADCVYGFMVIALMSTLAFLLVTHCVALRAVPAPEPGDDPPPSPPRAWRVVQNPNGNICIGFKNVG